MTELGKVPAWYLADNIINRWRLVSIWYLVEAVPKTDLGCNKCQRITCSLGCKSRRTAQTSIDLDYAIIHITVRTECKLNVALSDNTQVTDNINRKLMQIIQLLAGKCLGRRDHYTLTGMDSERVEVLHITDSETLVIFIPHYLKLNLLPSLKRLLHKDLRRESEGLSGNGIELSLIVTESRTETSKSISGPQNDRIAHIICSSPCLFD